MAGGEGSDDRGDLVVAALIGGHGVEGVVGQLTVARVAVGRTSRTHADAVQPAGDAPQRRNHPDRTSVRPPAEALLSELDPPMPVPVDPAWVRPLDQDRSHDAALHYFPFLPL